MNFKKIIQKIDHSVRQLNSSKIFAGLVVVILNISSKYVNLGLSKSMENYLKHSFSRNIMVAAILWMGSRDIYISIGLTIVFMMFNDFLWNEDSCMSIVPAHMKPPLSSDEDTSVDESIKKAKEFLEYAKTV